MTDRAGRRADDDDPTAVVHGWSTVEAAAADLFDEGLPIDVAVDRHYSPGFRQRADGVWKDRAQFVAGIAALRSAVQSVTVTVLDEVVDGGRYAERHVADARGRDGDRVLLEVSVFADRDEEGRFERVEETTRQIGASEAERLKADRTRPV